MKYKPNNRNNHLLYWRYTENYARQPWQGADGTYEPNWLNAAFGEIKPSKEAEDVARDNVVGYDVADFIRARLKQYGDEYTNLSICELIQKHERFEKLRQFVRPAELFWSHVQSEPLIGRRREESGGRMTWSTSFHLCMVLEGVSESLLRLNGDSVNPWHFGPREGLSASTSLWIDYFSLRQNQNDFDPRTVVALIAQIGGLVASLTEAVEGPGEIDNFVYLTRSFCVLEAYAAVKAQKDPRNAGYRFIVQQNVCLRPYEMGELLDKAPVNAVQAQTQRKKDKKQIDDFVKYGLGHGDADAGFKELNNAIEFALKRSCCLH